MTTREQRLRELESKDAARYRYLAQLADWSFIEHLCQCCAGRFADEFKGNLDAELDSRIAQQQALKEPGQ